MSQIKNKKHILAAIDHLRTRKSRPDINRICNFMLKHYKVPPKDTKADLKRCLKEKSVLKVDYKDNISYRNALKCRKKTSKNPSTQEMSVTAKERDVITSALATLIYQDERNLVNGIPFDDMVRTAGVQNSHYSRTELEALVNKELLLGTLIKLPNGALALGPIDQDDNSSDSMKYEHNPDSHKEITSSANSSSRSSPHRPRGRPRKNRGGSNASSRVSDINSAAVRVGERRKMAKKVFDPSETNQIHKRKRGRPVGSLNKSTIKRRLMIASQDKTCKSTSTVSECRSLDESIEENERREDSISREGSASHERSGGECSVCLTIKPSDTLVDCRDCSNKAHVSCIQSGSGILKPRSDNSWQCPHCKTCVICYETNDAGVLTVCSVCSDAYHAQCHTPRIPERMKAWDHWQCNTCRDPQPTAGSPTNIPKKCNSPTSLDMDPFLKPHELDLAPSKLREEVPVDPNIPDITNWNSLNVYEYFAEHHPEAAPILREQEFDGQALAMARRADIVRGLGLPLGPALRLYRIVVKLQTRKDDWTMCWA